MPVFFRQYVLGFASVAARTGRVVWSLSVLVAGAILALVIAIVSVAVFVVVWPLRKRLLRHAGPIDPLAEVSVAKSARMHETV
jgi:heme/copper-type cytochrome/quinol oxidase subunit 2